VGLRAGPGGRGELKRLYVRPAFRRRGIGRVLVDTMIEAARGRGYTSLCLDTLPSMEDAYRLYLVLGFEPTEPYYETPVPGTRFLAYPL
jgi:ribosomal protein S18 acetylase RimI-like enzyme